MEVEAGGRGRSAALELLRVPAGRSSDAVGCRSSTRRQLSACTEVVVSQGILAEGTGISSWFEIRPASSEAPASVMGLLSADSFFTTLRESVSHCDGM